MNATPAIGHLVAHPPAENALFLVLAQSADGQRLRLAPLAAPPPGPGRVALEESRWVAAAECRDLGPLEERLCEETLRQAAVDAARAYAAWRYRDPPFHPGITPVPPSGKSLGESDIAAMTEAVLDGWLTTGRFNTAFEKELAAFVGVKHAITTNSGSSANLLAIAALTSHELGERALQPGDEVLTVGAGFPTTVNPILLFGLTPVFVDAMLPSCNIDPDLVEAALSPRTRAIILAHTLGNPFDLDRITDIARRHGLWLVEDCCDALGSRYRERMVGTFGDLATVSFYPAHHITMGEGGAVLTNHRALKRIVESFRDWGRDCYCDPGKDNTCGRRFDWQLGDLPAGYDHKYVYSHLGFNLKITDLQAAAGWAQLQRLPLFVTARKDHFAHLRQRLAPLEPFLILPEATPASDPSWFGFPLTLRQGGSEKRLELLRFLESRKVGTRLLFAGNYLRQPYFRGRPHRVAGTLAQCDRIMNETFWIGLHPALSRPMLDHSADCLETFFANNDSPRPRGSGGG